MMTNKWVQAAYIGGIAFGMWLGGWVALIHPMAPLIVPIPIGFISIGITALARGTDGWGGPYKGPNKS